MKRQGTGRPRLDATDSTVHVSVRLTSREYDRVYAEARRGQVSVSDLIRRRTCRGENQSGQNK